jgi:hypothetical protein
VLFAASQQITPLRKNQVCLEQVPPILFSDRHLSLRVCGGRSWPGGCYPPSPSRLRCERAWWFKRASSPTCVAHPTHLAPHRPAQSPGRRHCCRRRCALTAPFHPLPGNPWRDCSLLPSCVTCALWRVCPHLRFHGVAFCQIHCCASGRRGVGKFL